MFKNVSPYIDLEEEPYFQQYYYLIVIISVKFIVGQLRVDQIQHFSDQHHAVNATACEFLELLLKNSKEKDMAAKTAHIIIDMIMKVLQLAINKKDNAMQVQLLNLLNVILFECQFSKNMENCRKVLTSTTFTDILVSGLKN